MKIRENKRRFTVLLTETSSIGLRELAKKYGYIATTGRRTGEGNINAFLEALGQGQFELKQRFYEYERLAVALRELPLNDTTLQAIDIICRVLKEQNPRFDSGLFMEWSLEGK